MTFRWLVHGPTELLGTVVADTWAEAWGRAFAEFGDQIADVEVEEGL